MATPIFRVKRASNSQDTVDYIVQKAARKNSSGNPGLSATSYNNTPHTVKIIIHSSCNAAIIFRLSRSNV